MSKLSSTNKPQQKPTTTTTTRAPPFPRCPRDNHVMLLSTLPCMTYGDNTGGYTCQKCHQRGSIGFRWLCTECHHENKCLTCQPMVAFPNVMCKSHKGTKQPHTLNRVINEDSTVIDEEATCVLCQKIKLHQDPEYYTCPQGHDSDLCLGCASKEQCMHQREYVMNAALAFANRQAAATTTFAGEDKKSSAGAPVANKSTTTETSNEASLGKRKREENNAVKSNINKGPKDNKFIFPRCPDKNHMMLISNYEEGEYTDGYDCNTCGKGAKGFRWFCQYCQYDQCLACITQQQQQQHQQQVFRNVMCKGSNNADSHTLMRVTNGGAYPPKSCKMCKRTGLNEDPVLYLCRSGHDYSLCVACASREQCVYQATTTTNAAAAAAVGGQQQPHDPSTAATAVFASSDSLNTQIQFPRCESDKHHPMIISNYSNGDYEDGFDCDTCGQHGTGFRWFCRSCQSDKCFNCIPLVSFPGASCRANCNESHHTLTRITNGKEYPPEACNVCSRVDELNNDPEFYTCAYGHNYGLCLACASREQGLRQREEGIF